MCDLHEMAEAVRNLPPVTPPTAPDVADELPPLTDAARKSRAGVENVAALCGLLGVIYALVG